MHTQPQPILQWQCMLRASAPAVVLDTIPEEVRAKYQGSSLGDVIGLIRTDAFKATWQLPFEKKRAIYGNRLASGGTQDKGAALSARMTPWMPTVCNFMPELFCHNLFCDGVAHGNRRPKCGAG